MVELWLMRHGESVHPEEAGSDYARTLSDRGRRQVTGLAHWLQGRVARPQRILHSPLIRTTQTAELLAAGLQTVDSVTCCDVLAPGMSADALLDYVRQSPQGPIVCIGHQPDIGRALQHLIGGGQFCVAPGFCAAIEFGSRLRTGDGQLKWVADPEWFG